MALYTKDYILYIRGNRDGTFLAFPGISFQEDFSQEGIMKIRWLACSFALCLMATWLLSGTAQAQQSDWSSYSSQLQSNPLVRVSRHNQYGVLEKIDHDNKRLYVTGFGSYDPDAVLDDADKQRQAILASRLDAQGKMAEIIGGVRVTGTESLKDMHVESTIQLLAEARLEGFYRENLQVKSMSDGSYLAIGTYRTSFLTAADLIDRETISRNIETVRPKVPALADQPTHALADNIIQRTQEALERDSDYLNPPLTVEAPPGQTQYTSLIVDARGTNARIVTLPRLISEDYRKVYGVEDVEFWSSAILGDIVHYARSLNEATNLEVAGNTPLVIKAQGTSPRNPGHIVIGIEDSQRIAAARNANDFFKNASVVFVF
jgi:hypothetical protein